MNSNDGRPIGLLGPDDEEYLSRFTTAEEIKFGLNNARMWLRTARGRSDSEYERIASHWERRIELLKAKALLLGIQPEE